MHQCSYMPLPLNHNRLTRLGIIVPPPSDLIVRLFSTPHYKRFTFCPYMGSSQPNKIINMQPCMFWVFSPANPLYTTGFLASTFTTSDDRVADISLYKHRFVTSWPDIHFAIGSQGQPIYTGLVSANYLLEYHLGPMPSSSSQIIIHMKLGCCGFRRIIHKTNTVTDATGCWLLHYL